MIKRIATALVLAAALILALRSGNPWIFGGLLSVLLLAGAWEWSSLCGLKSLAARLAFLAGIAAIIVVSRRYFWADEAFCWLMLLALLWWLAAFVWVLLAPARIGTAAAIVAGLLSLTPAWLALFRVAMEWPHRMRWTLLILVIPVAMDTGGYFAGSAFGRTKLAPRVSPGKTWEGVFGGLALVLLLAVVSQSLTGLPLSPWIALCLAAAALSVVGDLTESLLKRASGVKDSGRLFPGHGGVLDRVDSILAAAPVMTLGLIWLGAGR